MKKCLSALLATVLLMTMLPLSAVSVSAATIDNSAFNSKISYLKTVFRSGEYWNAYNSCGYEGTGSKKCPSCSSKRTCAGDCPDSCGQFYYNGKWISGQCFGWACKIGNLIFGGNPRAWGVHYNAANLKPGDIIYGDVSSVLSGATMHAIFITNISGNTITYADCNGAGPCMVKWDRTTSMSAVTTAVNKGAKIFHASNNNVSTIHTHSYSTYVYNSDAHPHYKCYKCSCGAVKENTDQPTYMGSCSSCNTTIAIGNYFIKNKADGQYLNVANGKDEDKNTIHTHTFGNWDSQVYNIYNATQGYEMMPLCSKTRVVNPYCWTVESGKTVNLYQRTYENSQWWRFQSVSGGYAIRNVQNPNLCLTTNTSNDALTVETYTGANNQIWFLEKACTISYNANGGQGTPSSHRTRAGYNTAISVQKPTRSGYTFLGWSTNPSATKVDVISGSSLTTSNSVTLYAVWEKDASDKTAVQITKEPATAAYAKDGATVSVKIIAEGEGLKYTWYIKDDGASKYSKPSVSSSTYSVIMSDKVHGRRVYCVVTDQYGNTAQSKTFMLRRQVTITKQLAAAAYAQSGKKVSVKITAKGDGLKYTWYIKNDGGSKYSKSSVTSSTYSTTMSSKVKGRRVYCVVKDKYGKSVQSKTFILRESVSITAQPKTVTVAKNKTAKVTVKASGDGLKYTWYIKNAGSSKYSKSSVKTASYSVKMTSKVKNRLVYCVVTDKYGKTVKTVTVKLKMK